MGAARRLKRVEKIRISHTSKSATPGGGAESGLGPELWKHSATKRRGGWRERVEKSKENSPRENRRGGVAKEGRGEETGET